MKTLLRFFVPCLLILSLHAQTQPKYTVLKTDNKDTFLDTVNQLADRGYRVLIQGPFTILRLDATPPDTYRYLRLEEKGGPAQFTNWINEQGAHGYRWLAHIGFLEKAPHPRNYEYRNSPHGTAEARVAVNGCPVQAPLGRGSTRAEIHGPPYACAPSQPKCLSS
jgi:hypothetical protein